MAIKKRSPVVDSLTKDIKAEQVEKFAAGADGGAVSQAVPDQNAIRKFKCLSVPLNQYEHEQLVIGARLSGRSKLNFIRHAMLKMTKNLQLEEEQ